MHLLHKIKHTNTPLHSLNSLAINYKNTKNMVMISLLHHRCTLPVAVVCLQPGDSAGLLSNISLSKSTIFTMNLLKLIYALRFHLTRLNGLFPT